MRISFFVTFDIDADWENGLFTYDDGDGRRRVVMDRLRAAAFNSAYAAMRDHPNHIRAHAVAVSEPIIEGQEEFSGSGDDSGTDGVDHVLRELEQGVQWATQTERVSPPQLTG